MNTTSEADISAIIEDFLARLRAGEEIDVYDVLEQNPDLAGELEEPLTNAQHLHELASDYLDTAAPPQEIPKTIGRYEIRGVLGQGASAIVYRAWDPKFQREVALKVIHGHDCDPRALGRFERDARIAAQLQHPNVVPLHETGCEGNVHWIDMALVDGEDLESRLRRQTYDFREAVALVHKVAMALDHAHAAGVIHRDIKPSNILIDAAGEPHLADFGLSRRLVGEETFTAQGQLLGTPAYMSPEQALGLAHEADARSDVYSLGVVFYRLLTGKLPFEADSSHGLISLIAAGNPPRPRSLRPEIPLDLELVCLKAMERDPTHRFTNAKEFADELGRWQRDEPINTRPTTRRE